MLKILSVISIVSTAALMVVCLPNSAFAIDAGTYRCPNPTPLPEDVIVLKFLTLNPGAVQVPYLDITRYYKKNVTEKNSDIGTALIQGIAIRSLVGESETLSLNSLRLEFENGRMRGCRWSPNEE